MIDEGTIGITAEGTENITPKSTGDVMADYLKYIERKPLNDELAAVQRGEEPYAAAAGLPVAGAAPEANPPESTGELTRAERVALRELKQSDGWPVLMGLLKKTFHEHEKRVIRVCKNDPLQNEREIAKQWAYLGAYEQVALIDVEQLVNAELKKLWEQER